jgi:hypothetical protein
MPLVMFLVRGGPQGERVRISRWWGRADSRGPHCLEAVQSSGEVAVLPGGGGYHGAWGDCGRMMFELMSIMIITMIIAVMMSLTMASG